jgi:hypothetical protein
MAILSIYGLSETIATATGELVTLVKITSAEVISSNKLRVHFDRNMKNDDNLINRLFYTIIPITSGAVNCYVSEVKIPYVTYPEYVDLITSEMTDSASYTVYVDTDGPTDLENTPVDPDNNDQTFVAEGITPTIDKIIAVSENQIDVVFSENMKINSAIMNISKYSFDNGLSVLSVISAIGDTVSLATSEQTPGIIYTLTVNP